MPDNGHTGYTIVTDAGLLDLRSPAGIEVLAREVLNGRHVPVSLPGRVRGTVRELNHQLLTARVGTLPGLTVPEPDLEAATALGLAEYRAYVTSELPSTTAAEVSLVGAFNQLLQALDPEATSFIAREVERGHYVPGEVPPTGDDPGWTALVKRFERTRMSIPTPQWVEEARAARGADRAKARGRRRAAHRARRAVPVGTTKRKPEWTFCRLEMSYAEAPGTVPKREIKPVQVPMPRENRRRHYRRR